MTNALLRMPISCHVQQHTAYLHFRKRLLCMCSSVDPTWRWSFDDSIEHRLPGADGMLQGLYSPLTEQRHVVMRPGRQITTLNQVHACCGLAGWRARSVPYHPPAAWTAGAANGGVALNPILAADPQVLGARAAVDLAGEPGRAVRAQLQGRRDGRAGHRHLVRAPLAAAAGAGRA